MKVRMVIAREGAQADEKDLIMTLHGMLSHIS